MSSTTPVKTARTLVPTSANNKAAGAGAYVHGSLDMRTVHGGLLTLKITNGGTLGAQCVASVFVAHDAGTTPTAGSTTTAVDASIWKKLWSFGGGTVSGTVTEQSIAIDSSAMHIAVEFNGNTTTTCSVEAYLSEITSYTTA